MHEVETSKFFIELDCLFDTRFATLLTFGNDVVKLAFNESYYTRIQDSFTGIDTKEFIDRYKNRDKAILKLAPLTPFAAILQEFVKETNSLIFSSPHHYIPALEINAYPYLLTESETAIILKSLSVITKEACDISIICEPIENITPGQIKNNYSIMAMYEYYQWLECHSLNNNLRRSTCPEITMFGPKIYFKDPPSQAELKTIENNGTNPFKAMETMAGPLIGLKLLPIETFSMAIKLKRANQNPPA